MPFSGGGGGQLSNHVHDNTPLQGGPLNFNNTTIGGMNAGDITYSDGAALQTLAYPAVPAGESLVAVPASTSPSWVAGGASGSMELIATQTLAVATSSITITPTTPISWDDVASIRAYFSGSQTGGLNLIRGLINGYTGGGDYYQAGDRNGSFYNQTGAYIELEGNSNTQIFGYIDMYGENSLDAGNNDEVKFIAHCTAESYYMTSYGQTTTGVAQPTLISFEFQSPSTLEAGSTLSLYRINK